MKALVALTVAALLACQISSASSAQSSADVQQQITVDGLSRTYLIHIPGSTDAPLPLVVVLHGGGGKSEVMQKITGMDIAADKHKFVAVYPQGLGLVFNDGGSDLGNRFPRDDVRFVRAVIKDAAKHANIDEDRVFVCGFSNDAAMSTRLALEAADVIKAAAMVSGGIYLKVAINHPAATPIPVMLIQGTADPCVPYVGGQTHGPYIKGTMFDGSAHGEVLSARDAVAFWCKIDRCGHLPQIANIPHVTMDSTSTKYELFSGLNEKDVAVFTVKGGGHCWPGGMQYFPVSAIGQTTGDFSASESIWRFFVMHSGKDRHL